MDLQNKTQTSTRRLTVAAVLGALAGVLMTIEIVLPFAPSFVKLDFSEIPVLLGGLSLGPGCGVIVAVLKVLIHALCHGSPTMGIGDLANFSGSLAFLLPALICYRRMNSTKGLRLSLLFATVFASFFLIAANYFVYFPAYFYLLGLKTESIVAAGAAVNPAIDSLATLMLYAMLPLNLLKYGASSFVAALLWRRLKVFCDSEN